MTARLFDHAEGRGGRTGVDDGRPGRVPALIREAALIALAAGLYTLVRGLANDRGGRRVRPRRTGHLVRAVGRPVRGTRVAAGDHRQRHRRGRRQCRLYRFLAGRRVHAGVVAAAPTGGVPALPQCRPCLGCTEPRALRGLPAGPASLRAGVRLRRHDRTARDDLPDVECTSTGQRVRRYAQPAFRVGPARRHRLGHSHATRRDPRAGRGSPGADVRGHRPHGQSLHRRRDRRRRRHRARSRHRRPHRQREERKTVTVRR